MTQKPICVRSIKTLAVSCVVAVTVAGAANAQFKLPKIDVGSSTVDKLLRGMKGPKDQDGCATTAGVAAVFAGSMAQQIAGGSSDLGVLAQYSGTMLTASLVEDLTCGERAEMGEAVTETLETKPDGETHAYTSEETGKQITVTPKETRQEEQQVGLKFRKPVSEESAAGMQVDGGYYEVTSKTVMMDEASPDARRPLKRLIKGAILHVAGRVTRPDEDWAVIDIDGLISGYVPMADLASEPTDPKVGADKAVSKLKSKDASSAAREARKRRMAERQNRPAEEDKTVSYSKEEVKETRAILKKNETTQQESTVTTECRSIDVSVEGQSETNKMCKSPTGVWVL